MQRRRAMGSLTQRKGGPCFVDTHSPSLSIVTRTLGGRTWHVNAELPDAVAALCIPDLGTIYDRPDITRIRNKRARRTMLVPCDGGLALIKEFRPLTARARIRSWVRGRPAQREWDWACRFMAAGVPMPRPWAYHDGGAEGTSWFIQEGLPHAEELLACYARHFAPHREAGDREAWLMFADHVGALLAAVHRSGANHPDLHPGNIICAGDRAATIRPYLVDYHSVRGGTNATRRAWEANLAKFVHSVDGAMIEGDVAAILSAYLRHMPDAPWPSTAVLTERVYADLPRRQTRRARSRASRVFVRSGRFQRRHIGNRRMWYQRQYDPDDVLALIAQLDDGTISPRKHNPGSLVTKAALPDGAPVWIKTYKHDGLWKQLEAWIGRAYGRRAWYAAERLLHLRVTAPRGVAYIEEWDGVRLSRSHLIITHVPHDTDLDTLLFTGSRLDGSTGALRRKRALIAALGQFVRHLHESGVYHRDLSAKNILITYPAADASGTVEYDTTAISVVDIDSVTFPMLGVRRRQRRMNLAQLTGLPSTVTRRDQLRFFRAYCAGDPPLRQALEDAPAVSRLGAKTQASWRRRERLAQASGAPGPHGPARSPLGPTGTTPGPESAGASGTSPL